MRRRYSDWPGATGHGAPEGESDDLRAAAFLLQQMAAEVKPLAAINATMATAVEALQRGVEALIPVVEFIPTVSEGPILNELKELARARIAGLVDQLEQITLQAESHVQEWGPVSWLRCIGGLCRRIWASKRVSNDQTDQ